MRVCKAELPKGCLDKADGRFSIARTSLEIRLASIKGNFNLARKESKFFINSEPMPERGGKRDKFGGVFLPRLPVGSVKDRLSCTRYNYPRL